ncbi:hypothetical protein B2J96_19040 [Mycobacterium shigaense]|nr:hypothetical protein B2J96_19040 [Mycobacterium shigaense]
MANASGATVIFLESHPTWIAAHRHERERQEAMRRHPSFGARRGSAELDSKLTAGTHHFRLYPGTDTPA